MGEIHLKVLIDLFRTLIDTAGNADPAQQGYVPRHVSHELQTDRALPVIWLWDKEPPALRAIDTKHVAHFAEVLMEVQVR